MWHVQEYDDPLTRSQDPRERKAVEEAIPQFKRRLEQLAKDEEEWRGKVNETEGQLKTEQAKLDALHNLLDQLDQALLNIAPK